MQLVVSLVRRAIDQRDLREKTYRPMDSIPSGMNRSTTIQWRTVTDCFVVDLHAGGTPETTATPIVSVQPVVGRSVGRAVSMAISPAE